MTKKEVYQQKISNGLIVSSKVVNSIEDEDFKNLFMRVNRLIYRSSQYYAMLETPNLTTEEFGLVKEDAERNFFGALARIIRENPKHMDEIMHEIERRLDFFVNDLEQRYPGSMGEAKLAKVISKINNNPNFEQYKKLLTAEELSDVQSLDSIKNLKKTFDYVAKNYNVNTDKYQNRLNKYYKNSKIDMFIKKTSNTRVNSRNADTDEYIVKIRNYKKKLAEQNEAVNTAM